MHIRTFRNGDETALRAIFHSSVHALGCKDHTTEQLDAWAPRQYGAPQWGERIHSNLPLIAEIEGHIEAYADLQASGHIDHFFVAGAYAGRGVARALMAHIHQAATSRGIAQLFADVSLTAEPFFRKSGFVIEARQRVEVRGVVLANARMCKELHTIYS